MADDSSLLILGVTILLLIVVGLCLTMAFRLLRNSATRRDGDFSSLAGAVERFDDERAPAQMPSPDETTEPASPEGAAPTPKMLGKKLSNAEMAAYWNIEATQAVKADQYEAMSYAQGKAEYYKHLARHEQKAAAAERRRKRIEALADKKPK
jgi:hypothetical protein